MESWNSSLKCELGGHFESPADAQSKVFDYIEASRSSTTNGAATSRRAT
jgi:hypothetical protein